MNIILVKAGAYWMNDVKQVGETDKAVLLEVEGDRRFVDAVGARAWFPKSALDCETVTCGDGEAYDLAEVKSWFIRNMSRRQEMVTGRLA